MLGCKTGKTNFKYDKTSAVEIWLLKLYTTSFFNLIFY